jgi:hypothetical protein
MWQASISPAPGGGIMTVELPGNEGFGICGSCIKVEGLQEQPMITMVTSGKGGVESQVFGLGTSLQMVTPGARNLLEPFHHSCMSSAAESQWN